MLVLSLATDSQTSLLDYLQGLAGQIRFFSYGSNMNKEKFLADMQKAAKELKLELSTDNQTKLELDPQAIKRTLLNFKRELSNESKKGRAFSIYPSDNEKVEGICHNIDASVLPAFLKKEGLFNRSSPSYKLIRVHVVEEEKEVLTLLGLKPQSIRNLGSEQIQNTLEYVSQSIIGATRFNVAHEDMKKIKSLLNEMRIKQNGEKVG